MKKILLCLLALSISLYSCKKESPAQKVQVKLTTNSLQSTPSYYYVDLILDQRPVGQNYDTYHVTYAGVLLTISNLYWDSATYPALVNGIPVYGTVSVNPSTIIDGLITPATGNGVGGTQNSLIINKLCGLPAPKLSTDILKYEAALLNVPSTGIIPLIDNYVKGDYGSAGCTQLTYNFKLIRCTTGTNFGLATGDYPYGARSSNSLGNPFALVLVTDPGNSGITYELYGTNGIITGYTNKNTGLTDLGASVTGSFTAIPNNSTNFHCIGKIFRSNGTYFSFDVTQDIY